MRSVFKASSVLVVALGATLFQGPVACSSSSDSTTGKRITLDVDIAPTPESTHAFTNAYGWSVTIDKALVATGPLYYYDGATIFSERDSVTGWFGIRSAYAHPGHYIPGDAVGQMLVASSADLMKGTTRLGSGDGVTGTFRSATFSFQTPAQGPLASSLAGNAAAIEGTATKGADTRTFRAEVTAEEILNTESKPAVEGCPFIEFVVADSGVVTIHVALPLWFDQVDFSTLPVPAAGQPAEPFPKDSEARNGLVRGMKAGLGYTFTYGK